MSSKLWARCYPVNYPLTFKPEPPVAVAHCQHKGCVWPAQVGGLCFYHLRDTLRISSDMPSSAAVAQAAHIFTGEA
jgi:hypothetical protein